MKKLILWSAAGALILSAAGCQVDREAQKQSKATEQVVNDPLKAVSVRPAVSTTLTEDVEITGDITAGEDTTIGSKQNNRVVAVYVKDGDTVTAGQLLAIMDDSGAMAQLKQAQAQVATAVASMSSARSQISQATRNLAVGPHKSTVQVMLANAQVEGSKRALDKMNNGARPEERRQAIATLESAKANLDLQEKQLERTKALVDEGALAGQNLDTQKAAYDQALAQYKNAQEAVKINDNGNRPEDIDSAKAALKQAEDNLKNAEDQKKLDPLLKDQLDSANAQMESARAQLESARAQIVIAQQAVADTKVFAPFSGKVSGKPIQAGTVAGSSTAIVRIIGGEGIYFSGQIPSNNIDRVHTGDSVKVRVDGIPDASFSGMIVGLNPLADTVGRLFSVRVLLTGSSSQLKPGMFAHGNVAIRTVPHAIVVPSSAILAKGDQHYLFTVEGKKAHLVNVTVGLIKGEVTQVIGLPEGASVIVEGQNDVIEGTAVKVKANTTARLDSSGEQSEAKG